MPRPPTHTHRESLCQSLRFARVRLHRNKAGDIPKQRPQQGIRRQRTCCPPLEHIDQVRVSREKDQYDPPPEGGTENYRRKPVYGGECRPRKGQEASWEHAPCNASHWQPRFRWCLVTSSFCCSCCLEVIWVKDKHIARDTTHHSNTNPNKRCTRWSWLPPTFLLKDNGECFKQQVQGAVDNGNPCREACDNWLE
jgi:hypothetical protein